MPAKDTYHAIVRQALINDGWQITHDPYTMEFGERGVYIDLGAEQPVAAEKEGRKIAVEIKSFRSDSDIRDLEDALGQFVFYRSLLSRYEADRVLYLAVPEYVFEGLLHEPIARPPLEDLQVPLIVFDPEKELIVKWKH